MNLVVAVTFTVNAPEKEMTLRETRRTECDTCSEFGCGKFHYVQVAWYGSACITAITVTTLDKQLSHDEHINESDFPNDTLWFNTTSMSALREMIT